MATHELGSLLLCVLLLNGFALRNTEAAKLDRPIVCDSLDRTKFDALKPGFVFGAASAAYQVEGAWNEDGKGPSLWDTFTHNHPEKIDDRSNGDVAIDQYHLYKKDVAIMKDMKLDAYRFSISWPRLLPNGTLSGGVNRKGIEYYDNLINELIRDGIQPFVTIFHWDVPQGLEDAYGGFLSARIVDDFKDYAELCFSLFGDRVKHWITLNEPYTFSNHAYTIGIHAPGRCSAWQDPTCLGGDSATEPYLVTHHQLLAHAAAVKVYKDKFQAYQNGVIGITLVTHWFEPASDAKEDIDAANRALDFMFGWFMDPITRGDYPYNMQCLVRERLPKFTEEESKTLTGSFDFVGLNYYSARYGTDVPKNYSKPASYLYDPHVTKLTERDGIPFGPQAASDWLYVYPKGIHDSVIYTKNKYGDPIIYITENGVDEVNNSTLSLDDALYDTNRTDYYNRHLCYLQEAIKKGSNVKGFFAWSILDNFEWNDGCTVRFGINYVDYDNGLQRYPKLSTNWFKNFLKKRKGSSNILANNVGDTDFLYQV